MLLVSTVGCQSTSPVLRIFPNELPRVPHRAMRTLVKGENCGGYWYLFLRFGPAPSLSRTVMLNYAALGQLEPAAVQARQLNERLSWLEASRPPSVPYKDDPWGRYLAGLVYEAAGQPDDGLVDFRRAIAAYERSPGASDPLVMPPALVSDAMRVAAKLGMGDIRDELARRAAVRPADPFADGRGEVILVVEAGFAPFRVRQHWSILGLGEVPYPAARRRWSQVRYARMRALDSDGSATAQRVGSLRDVAVAALAARMHLVRKHGLTRAGI